MSTGKPVFTIRATAESDLKAITRIYNQAIALGYVTADTDPVDEESRRDMWATISHKQQRPFWVAEQNGEVMAFFYFRNFYDRPAYRITAEIGIYIDQTVQGKSWGKQILEYCLEQAPQMGIENILALIFATNQPSINLFKKYGFEEKGFFPQLAKKENGYNDLLILLKRL